MYYLRITFDVCGVHGNFVTFTLLRFCQVFFSSRAYFVQCGLKQI